MMKKLFLALVCLPTLLLSSCSTSIVEVAASGKPYEIFVIAPKPVWNSIAGDTLRTIMSEEVLWVNQPEPIFDLFNITPEAFNNNVRTHRNLIMLKVDKAADSVTFAAKEDVWVNSQIVIDITAPSDSALANYIGSNASTIVNYLSIVEQNRMKIRAAKYNEKNIEQTISKKFDFKMVIPQGYRVALDTTNFLWITYEMPLASQGIIIYTFAKPEQGLKLNLVDERNLAVANVPGPVKGSRMSTDTTFMPESVVRSFDGRAWIETRGFWNVKGDFMGGPFINYTTFDEVNHRYIGIDMYVNSPSPKYPKRNYIRQLESIMLGVTLGGGQSQSKSKTFTQEEVARLCEAAFYYGVSDQNGDLANNIKQWINQNVK